MAEKKKRKVAKVLRSDDAKALEAYDFFSYNQEREYKEHLDYKEREVQKLRKVILLEREAHEKLLAEKDVAFNTQLEQVSKQKFDEGYTQGLQKGTEDGRQSVIESAQYLKNCGDTLVGARDDYIKESETTLLKLAIFIAEKIIGIKIEEVDDIIINTIKKALEQISEKTQVQLKISQIDLEQVKDKLPQIKSIFDDIEKMNIEIDQRVFKGGIIIETNSGILDARIKTQIDEIYQYLLDKQS